jgi:long-chain-fatty-acid--CoA ligase ACSBG
VISKLDDVTVFAVSVVLSFIVNFSTEISYFVASKVILSKIHEKVGLNKCKACFTAAAPISVDTLSYFASIDIPVFEVFGQSECTGPHTVSAPGQWRIGYCGRPMPGTESMIAKDTNELCYRGRHIMMGYMYMKDKTDEAIDADGYLHSGDVAEFDENEQKGFTGPSGFMRITGRIKELIITAGGENIPPVLIENEMKAAMNAISNCMVIGDKKKFLTILISLKTEVDKETGVPTDKLAADSLHAGKQIGSKATTISEAAKDPVWDKYLTDGIKVANSKTTSQAQIVQKYKLLPIDFSEKGGELTPTLKLKRNIATEKYKDLIESMYAE